MDSFKQLLLNNLRSPDDKAQNYRALAVLTTLSLGLVSCSGSKIPGAQSPERYPAYEETQQKSEWSEDPQKNDAPLKASRSSTAPHAAPSKEPVHTASHAAPKNPVVEFFQQIHKKVSELSNLEVENKALKAENAALRLMLENERYSHQTEALAKAAEQVKKDNLEHTASPRGRTIASLRVEIPYHLEPPAMLALAVSNFKARNYEQSAGLIRYVLGQSPELNHSDHALMLGVSWYQMENYKEAKIVFDEMLKSAIQSHDGSKEVQARMWLALIGRRLGEERVAVEQLKEALRKYPKAPELAWVNVNTKQKNNNKDEEHSNHTPHSK